MQARIQRSQVSRRQRSPFGQSAELVGTGNLDEAVEGATFDLEMTGAIGKLLSCKGDASAAKTCNLPLGTGSLTFEAMTFPLAKGVTNVKVNMNLHSTIPPPLFSTTTKVTATSTKGDKLFCMVIKSSKASEPAVHPERAAQISEIQNTPAVHPERA